MEAVDSQSGVGLTLHHKQQADSMLTTVRQRVSTPTLGSLTRVQQIVIIGALLLIAALLAGALLPNGLPLGILILGALIGGTTGLAAVGVILVWRANRVINFAAGALGGAAGFGSTQLYLNWDWPYAVAVICSVLTGIALGALVEFAIIRRFRNAPRIVLTVATIGLAQLLGGLELEIPKRVFGEESFILSQFSTPLSNTTVTIGPIIITGDQLLMAAVVPIVVIALAWFLRKSLAGTAIRAASENTDRARLLGIPVGRLTTLVWATAGGLAALTFSLRAPYLGATPSAIAGPAVMLPALAAAVVARMESMPVAFCAAIVLGIVDQTVRWNTSSPELVDVVLLIVILVALLAQRSKKSRAHDADGGATEAELLQPLHPSVAGLMPVVWMKRSIVIGLVVVAVVTPLLIGPSLSNSFSIMAIWAMVAISLVVLTGWAGQISLGQFALVGVGALIAGNLISRWEVDLFISLAAATAAGAIAALLLGVPALRIRGPFLAVVTLAFAVVLDGYVLNPNVFPGLIAQDVARPVLWGRVDLENERYMLWFCLAALAVAIILTRGIRSARSGRLMIATRDNAKATEATSVSTRKMTLNAFLFSGALAGLAGGLHVMLLHGARVGSYQPISSIEIFSMTTIGGMGSIGGAISGAAGMRGLQDLDATLRLVIAGIGVLIVLWLIPSGLAGLATRVRDFLIRPIARRHGLELNGETYDPDSAIVETELEHSPEITASTPPPVPNTVTGEFDASDTAPTGQQPLLSARNIDVSYGRLQVLFGVDLEVQEGEIVALLGTNGAGKSTLLKAICGLSPSRGEITLAGDSIHGQAAEDTVRSGVALMPGGKAIFPTLTVAEHLRLSTWTFRSDRNRIETDIAKIHEMFPILKERSNQLAGDLSGGEQQQLALAMTLMLRPKVLLIDELSLGLAPMVVAMLCGIVRQLNREGITVIVVEQSVNVALTLAERAVFLEKGECRFEGPTADLLERPDVLRSVFLQGASATSNGTGHMNPLESEVDVVSANGSTNGMSSATGSHGDIIDIRETTAALSLLGQSLTPSSQDDENGRLTQHGPILECRGVTKKFGGINALSDVDLIVNPGEIVGLIGQNGAGKTTLMDGISGFHHIDSGAVVFRGHDITVWQPYERARGRLGRTFQEARLYPSLTVLETVSVACELTAKNRSLIADATRQPASYLAEAETQRKAEELISLLGLTRYMHTQSGALSTGTRRIVELACLLAEEPVLMLLDEPSAGVAQKETEALGPLLRRIAQHTGSSMVIIEHDMPLLSGLCDRLVAMELGQVIADGSPTDVLNHPQVIASYLGTDSAAINRSGVVADPV